MSANHGEEWRNGLRISRPIYYMGQITKSICWNFCLVQNPFVELLMRKAQSFYYIYIFSCTYIAYLDLRIYNNQFGLPQNPASLFFFVCISIHTIRNGMLLKLNILILCMSIICAIKWNMIC